jgi:hypothetical protein
MTEIRTGRVGRVVVYKIEMGGRSLPGGCTALTLVKFSRAFGAM